MVPKESHGRGHRSDLGLRFREFQVQLIFQELRQCRLLVECSLPSEFTARTARCAHENDEVIGIPNRVVYKLAPVSVMVTMTEGALLYLLRVGTKHSDAAGPHVAFVPLVNDAQGNVGEKRG
jgi:hypothetical protein